jgi:hypothetical protein
MGSGFFFNAYVMTKVSPALAFEIVKAGPSHTSTMEDFVTNDSTVAHKVIRVLQEANPSYAHIDLIKINNQFKIAFFK